MLAMPVSAIGSTIEHYDIVVSPDGHGDYMTIQEAIDAVPDYSHERITTILIKEGTYYGQVTIPHNKFRIHIKGEGAGKTVITYDKYAKKLWPDSDMQMGTSGSATMYIHSSYVTLEDLTVENSSGEGKSIGQAVALFTDGDFIFVHRCCLKGNQDTLYTYGRYGKDGGIKRNYYLDCYIEGTTDFIFGPSICLFENCAIHSKKNSYVTAASTLPGQKYGYVFRGCTLTADPSVTKCYLGRPWGAYAKTVFIDCKLGSHILPEGWHDWEKPGKPDTKKNSYYAEYNCSGPGAVGRLSTSAAVKAGRVKWAHQLTDKQAAEYTFEKIMYQENDGIVWKPYDRAKDAKSMQMVCSEMNRNTTAAFLDGMKGKLKWNYTVGLELQSFLDAAHEYGAGKPFAYAKQWVDTVLQTISNTGKTLNYKKKAYVLDHICPGRTCIALYEKTGDVRYKSIADSLFVQLQSQPRTQAGPFWHKASYPHQVWLDGVYMAMPFYASYIIRYIPESERGKYWEDIVSEFVVTAEKTLDPVTKLYRHAWDESKSMFWADPATGLSAHAWGRADGWFAMALVDVLEIMPENVPGREKLVGIVRHLADTLPKWADSQSGMWYQVLDRPAAQGNYLESSCSIMFTYMYLKASRLGLLKPSDKDYARNLYKLFNEQFVRLDSDCNLNITSCCSVAGLGGKQNRKGDYEYYLSEPVIDNDCKSVGAYIMASLEYERYFK